MVEEFNYYLERDKYRYKRCRSTVLSETVVVGGVAS